MPKRSSKPSSDPNRAAFDVVNRIAGGWYCPACEPSRLPPELRDHQFPHTCPKGAAAALGRLGGLKGGKARAEKLSPEERSEIGKAGAAARWKKK